MAKSAILAVKILGDATSAIRSMQESSRAAGALQKGMKATAAAVGAAAVATGAYVLAGISKAGDLEQSIGAVDTVFKENAATVHKWADTASTALGLTKNEYNELGTLIGTQLKNGGTAMDALAPKTNELITLGADLASMFGGTTADAVGALSSALKGERDPIERYGVSLNQARIDAKAAELGFRKVGGALSAEASQAATLALIMEQTKDAHGNFAKETDTWAHQVQVFKASMSDVQTQIASIFLPVLTRGAKLVNSTVVPALQRGAAAVTALKDSASPVDLVQRLGLDPSSGLGAAVLGTTSFLTGLGDHVRRVRDTLRGLGGTQLAGVAAAVGAVALAFTPFKAVLAAVGPLIAPLLGHLGTLARVVGLVASPLGIVSALFLGAVAHSEPLRQALGELVGSVLDLVGGLARQLGPALGELAGAALPALQGAASALIPAVSGILEAVVPVATVLVTSLAPILLDLVSSVIPPVIDIFGLVGSAVTALLPAFTPLVEILGVVLVGVVQNLIPVVTVAFETVAAVIRSVLGIVHGIVKVFTGLLTGDWQLAWTGVAQILSSAWDGILALARGALRALGAIAQAGIRGVVSLFSDLPGQILRALGGVGGLLVNAGKAIIEGLFAGLKHTWGKVADFIQGIGPWIAEHKGPISYDRRLLIPAGLAIMGGFVGGLKGGMPALQEQIAAVTAAVETGVRPYVPLRVETEPGAEPGYEDSQPRRDRGRPGDPPHQPAVINITINAGFGTDPVALGREVKRVIREYETIMGEA
ncbi:hypothetical protein [Arthrobacter sp. UM1]|uniref:phage tail protein n=1 Tax=Arthrobacter sp. UM1 TaxID=2766776 RepID=UPI001CF68DC7|nr:hypothetical protein [Arthrobacter sp. UM1]MCB4209161.1 hypothetical protein [Arthrobacter sp. UM1]